MIRTTARLSLALAALAILAGAPAALASDVKAWVHDGPPAAVSAGGVVIATKHYQGALPTPAAQVSFDGVAPTKGSAAASARAAADTRLAAAPCACSGC